ncbi:MAG: hypothetical protein IVW55_03525 [Chloroflexi bacterium]|nr:hypothetical protein [Chloroflexota bacterium]
MGYSEALEQHLAALRFVESPSSLEWFRTLAQGSGLKRRSEGSGGKVSAEEEAASMRDFLAGALRYGETYWWAPEFCDVLDHAAATMPDWTLRAESMPSEAGFAWFSKPIIAAQNEHTSVRILAVAWVTAGDPGALDPNSLYMMFYADVVGRNPLPPGPAGNFIWDFGLSRHEAVRRAVAEKANLADAADEADVANGDGRTEPYVEQLTAAYDNRLRVLGAMFEFQNQHILVAEPKTAERATRRRFERAHAPLSPVVRVIRLRKREYAHSRNDEHAPREWSCQWIVRGHWRQQFYPGDGSHRPKWILPYVKGDPSKPLRPPRATVFAVTR